MQRRLLLLPHTFGRFGRQSIRPISRFFMKFEELEIGVKIFPLLGPNVFPMGFGIGDGAISFYEVNQELVKE